MKVLKFQNLKQPVKLDQSGFTLTEMLIVVAIIALIGTFVAGNVMSKFSRAKVDATKIQIKNLSVVLDDFKRECGFYPTTEQGLDALIQKPTSGRDCKNYDPEGYIKGKRIPKDGWDQDFLYESDGNRFVIRTLGADLAEGGQGNDADISSEDAI